MNTDQLLRKATSSGFLTTGEGLHLFQHAPLGQLMAAAQYLRLQLQPRREVTWIIDRNVNITNVCISGCRFCNFYRTGHSPEAYITTIEEYCEKIDEMYTLGGNQLLLQGGLHPKLGLEFYEELFSTLKQRYPDLRLHALGPPEIAWLSRQSGCSHHTVLERLVKAGLTSLPGAGAEILSDRVRKILSPAKCSADEWLEVMRVAHRMDLTTSATMMFGHIETLMERMEHLAKIRSVQAEKPTGHKGFLSFIPWPFQDEKTRLRDKQGVTNRVTALEYIRMIAIARLMLPNIPNIQASWLTVGKETAQLCLHAGANDFGSIMIEENVVRVAGASHTFDAEGIRAAILEAGFSPRLRDQDFQYTVGKS